MVNLKTGKVQEMQVKFIYSEKATKICEISTVDLSYVVTVKSTVEISQKFVAFSEYINFKFGSIFNSSLILGVAVSESYSH